jgi:hypothetical protein
MVQKKNGVFMYFIILSHKIILRQAQDDRRRVILSAGAARREESPVFKSSRRSIAVQGMNFYLTVIKFP